MKFLAVWTKIKWKTKALTLRATQWRSITVIKLRQFRTYTSNCAVSILGVIFAVGLAHPTVQRALGQFKNLDAIFVTSAGLIGTMLALVFSLSIIPIQRAAESFTPSVIRLYSKDKVTHAIFIVLAIFCLVSFIMAAGGFIGLQARSLLPVQIFVIAAALDLLRWHHRRVTHLLQPGEAVSLLSDEIKRNIDLAQQRVSHQAQTYRRSLQKEEKIPRSQRDLESDLYAWSHYDVLLNGLLGEFAETALKAVSRRETYTAQVAVSAMSEAACYYLDRRKDNLVLSLKEGTLIFGSDVDVVLKPILEHFKDINRDAVIRKAETTSIHVAQALGRIASHTANLKAHVFREHTAPLTWLPLGYLRACVEVAQREGLDDAALQGSSVFLSVGQGAPENVQATDVHLHVIEGCDKIAKRFMVSGKDALANESVKDMMTLVHHLMDKKHFQLNEITRAVLEKLEVLAPLAVAREKDLGLFLVSPPLAPAYDLASPVSLAYLVGKTALLIRQEDMKNRVNPYGQLIALNNIIYRHFRSLAENVDLGSSFLLWHITRTIKHICHTSLVLLEFPAKDNLGSIPTELAGQISWYLTFFWVAFSKTTMIDLERAKDACDVLAYVGMSFFNAGYPDLAETSASNITSIVNSYCKAANSPSPYGVAHLLMFIWYIRRLAVVKDNKTMMTKSDESMEKPRVLRQDQWPLVQEALETEKKHLEKELHEVSAPQPVVPGHETRALLKHLLQKGNHHKESS